MVEDIKKINLKDKSEINESKDNMDRQKIDSNHNKNKKLIKIFGISLLGVFIFTLVIFLPILLLSIPLTSQLKNVYRLGQETYQAVKDQDLVLTEEKLTATQESLLKAQKSYKRLVWTKFIPIISAYYKDGESFLNAGSSGLEAAQILVSSITPYADVLGLKGKGSFTGGTAEDRIVKIIETLSKVTPQIEQASGRLEEVQKQLNNVNPNRYPTEIKGIKIREQLINIRELVGNTSKEIANAQPALEALPQVLGYPESRKYLIIMQNDGELRPTGGFMTAYAIIKIESGKIIPETSGDIYSLDEKAVKRVPAPDSIKQYLLSADLNTGIVPFWYLRDMNLSPDFKVSMDTFNTHYLDVPGVSKVDGIIAIDTKVLKDFLTILGPIEVLGYGTFTMDKDPRCHDIPQVVCEIEHIVDTPIPGIKRGRKDILGPMMKTIISKIFDSPSSMWPGIFKVGLTEIEQKHILFYFTDEKEQIAAEKINAAGRIKEFSGDFLHINDTNFGGAKSNLFVEQEVEQEIFIKDDGTIEKKLTITYTNPEPMDNCNLERVDELCLNGILRDFLRVYVPKGSRLIEGIGSESEVKTYEDLDKSVFEGFFTLRGDGGRAKVILTYELPFKFPKKDGLKLLIQKQPGTEGNHYKTLFNDEVFEFSLTSDKELEL